MKINDVGRIGNVNPYKQSGEPVSTVKSENKSRSKDEVKISSEAMALLETRKKEITPDDRIELLRKSIQEGTYHVETRHIAEKLANYYKSTE
jgi:negative regulator of flagellin synthesis FlgM